MGFKDCNNCKHKHVPEDRRPCDVCNRLVEPLDLIDAWEPMEVKNEPQPTAKAKI